MLKGFEINLLVFPFDSVKFWINSVHSASILQVLDYTCVSSFIIHLNFSKIPDSFCFRFNNICLVVCPLNQSRQVQITSLKFLQNLAVVGYIVVEFFSLCVHMDELSFCGQHHRMLHVHIFHAT